MTEEKKPAIKKIKKAKNGETLVKVENTSDKRINVSTGPIDAGEKGECTVAEARQYNNWLKEI